MGEVYLNCNKLKKINKKILIYRERCIASVINLMS